MMPSVKAGKTVYFIHPCLHIRTGTRVSKNGLQPAASITDNIRPLYYLFDHNNPLYATYASFTSRYLSRGTGSSSSDIQCYCIVADLPYMFHIHLIALMYETRTRWLLFDVVEFSCISGSSQSQIPDKRTLTYACCLHVDYIIRVQFLHTFHEGKTRPLNLHFLQYGRPYTRHSPTPGYPS